jgi:ribosomal protein S18 acetylase RimI-like enzyme
VTELRPISSDRENALLIARRAILARNDPEAEAVPFLSMVEREVAEGTALGVLRLDGDRIGGIALWEAPTPLGVTLQLVYLVEGGQTPADYRSFFTEIRGVAGPIVFAPGPIAGLTESGETEVMNDLGFARFSRSEMRYPPHRPPPERRSDPAVRLREAHPDDQPGLARLHEVAYRGTFDQHLFLADLDPARDAELAMRDVIGGRWGEFLPWASAVVEAKENLVAASLVVRASYGPLVADVMVDPRVQGHGLGSAVLVATIRALRGRDEAVIVLNVTEGNTRAHRLYERLGFVRTLGPSQGWYSTERIPVSPRSG